VAVNAATGAVSPFVSPAGTGSTNSQITGLVVGGGFLYYGLSDVSNTTATDVLRRVPLAGGAEQTVVPAGTSGYPATPTLLAYDAATDRIFVVNAFNNAQSIVAVNAATGAVSPFVSPAGTGSTNSQITGLVVGGGFLYYGLSDVSNTTATDVLRRVPLAGGAEQTVVPAGTSGYPATPTLLAYDAATNRIFVVNAFNNAQSIVAVNAATGAVSPFVAPAGTGSTNSQITGLVVGTPLAVPTVTTAAATSITTTSAVLGGNVTADGGGTVADRGVVYSSSNQTPAIGGSGVTQNTNGTGTGPFSKTITGLTASTTYYVRAYATNAAGTSYGTVSSFTTAAPVGGTTVVTNVSCNGGTNGAINLTPTGGVAPYTFLWSPGGQTTEDRTGLAAGTYTVTITDATGATGTVSATVTQPTALTASTSQTNIACNGGATGVASVSPIGGTSPYTFRWSTGATTQTITGLAAGSYSVVITDANGCAIGRSFIITEPSALTATTSQTNVTTNGGNNGSATITVSGGTPGYTYSWSPNVSTTATASNLSAGTYTVTVTDANSCTIARTFTITQPAFMATAQPVTVQLDANGNGTLNASSVNNGSTGSGTLTYTIQKIAFGYIPEGITPLTLTTPNGANFTQIRFASYGTPNNNSNGNYTLGSCNAANSLAAAQNAYVGRSTGDMYASNTDTRNNPVLGDPCGGTPKALAVQVGYSADAASLTYNCTEAGKTQYVLLTVTNGTNTSTAVAQVTVNAPPTATISSVSPTSAQRGTPVTVAGTNLSGVSSVTVNGATATVSNVTATGFTFVVPNTATFGPGSLVVATPCAQTLTTPFTVVAPALTATVSGPASPTSTSPLQFSVTFSQSVGTTFTAADVTVANGTVTSGSFSGSGAGPYAFTVTPTGTGTVLVSLAANVAQDANNTGNTASNTVSVQFQAPTIVVAPASLPFGVQGQLYSQALSATGGTAPYSYAITAGALPAGLSLTNGTIAGTPTTNGTFNFTVTATDASAAPGPYSGSRSYTLVINTQPTTAAPVITTPANGSFSNNRSVTATGTAPAGSIVSIYIGVNLAGTTSASAAGAFSYLIPGTAPDGTYTVSATAQSSGATVSPVSNINTFTIDGTAPNATLSSSVPNNGTTTTSPVSFTATFNEPVTGLTAAGLTVTNGTVTSGPTAGSGNTYTFQVTPSTAGTVTVRVAANAAQDRATNGNTASALYSLTFVAPAIAVAPASLNNGQQGVAYSQALSATGGTAPYTYAITAGALPAGLSLTNGTIAGTPTTNGTFNFTVTATDASTAPGPYSGSQAYSLVITAPAITATTWTGTISTDWFTAGNWTQGVPDATIDATIPTAPSGGRFPNISAGTATVRNLTFNSGATLTQSGGTLAIAANLTNNGTFLPTSGTVVLGNTAFSNIFGASSIRFWNLTVGTSGAQLSTSIGASVQRLLTLNGNFSTNGNQFVLESNNTLTALVVNNSSNVVTGTVTVQRAIDPSVNPGLGYRHYSSPVSNSTVGDLATSGFTPLVNPAFNTVASPYTITPFPTVYGYDDSRLSLTNNLDMFDKGFFSPSALSDPLAVGKGYTVNIAATEVVDFQGTLNNGDLPLNLTSTRNTYPSDGGWQFLGNPYPAPLDYSRVAAADRAGLESAIYIYSSTSQYMGRYRVYVNGIGNPVVPLGQGFFARAASGQATANMTFRNSQRLTVPNGTTLQRTTADPRPLVQLTLQGQGAALADEAYVYFENGATSGFDLEYDAEKLPNPSGLNLATHQVSRQLSIDGQPELGTAQRVVPLAVGVPAPGVYTFTASQLLNLSAVPVYLRDVQTGALLDLRQQPSYQFTVANAAALNTTRFELIFSPQQPLATVPAALAQQVAVYPNPARTQVAIELPLGLSRQPTTAALLDALGRVVRTQQLPAGLATHTLPLADLATGVYSLRLTTEQGTVVKKLVIE
jgi:methionine-rich copper-binding protein CopC